MKMLVILHNNQEERQEVTRAIVNTSLDFDVTATIKDMDFSQVTTEQELIDALYDANIEVMPKRVFRSKSLAAWCVDAELWIYQTK
jgi:hypothetical protein